MLLQMALFHSFYGWVIFQCIYIPHLFLSVHMYHVFIFHSLGCSHVLAIVNSTSMNKGVYVSFWIRVFSRYMPIHGILVSYDNSVFNVLSNLHTVFHVVLVVKNLPANAGDLSDSGSIPGSKRSPGEGHGNPLQYSCLENPMDRGA